MQCTGVLGNGTAGALGHRTARWNQKETPHDGQLVSLNATGIIAALLELLFENDDHTIRHLCR